MLFRVICIIVPKMFKILSYRWFFDGKIDFLEKIRPLRSRNLKSFRPIMKKFFFLERISSKVYFYFWLYHAANNIWGCILKFLLKKTFFFIKKDIYAKFLTRTKNRYVPIDDIFYIEILCSFEPWGWNSEEIPKFWDFVDFFVVPLIFLRNFSLWGQFWPS